MSCDNLEELIQNLIEGNQTFIDNPKYEVERNETQHQDPCVIVVSCSDSRVSIPVVFNFKNLGVFFEVKTAGQVLNSSDLESIKYAVDSYDTLAIIMLGHTGCGAVKATVESITDPEKRGLRNEFPTITSNIAPSVYKVMQSNKVDSKEQLVSKSIIQNIFDKTRQLEFLFGDQMHVIPALYNILSGKVTLL